MGRNSGGGGRNSRAATIRKGLNQRESRILSSLKGGRRNLSDLPGVVTGRQNPRITKPGASAVNSLANQGLIRQTAVIGRDGQRQIELTDLGRSVAE